MEIDDDWWGIEADFTGLKTSLDNNPGIYVSIDLTPSTFTATPGYKLEWVTQLVGITLPVSCTDIRGGTWYNFSALARLDVSPGNTEYSSIDGVLYNADKTALLYCPPKKTGTLAIPDGVTTIRGGTVQFNGSYVLDRLVLPASVQVIERGAFEGIETVKNGFEIEFKGTIPAENFNEQAQGEYNYNRLRECYYSKDEEVGSIGTIYHTGWDYWSWR